jgi:ABC-type glycerol-3-phosphate transport system substrate-binding protein
MYKFLVVLAVAGLTACGSSASSDAATTTDSTIVITATPDTTRADSSVLGPTTGDTAK